MPAALLQPIVKRSLIMLVTLAIGLFALLVLEQSAGSNGPTVLPSITKVGKPGPPPGNSGNGHCAPAPNCKPSK